MSAAISGAETAHRQVDSRASHRQLLVSLRATRPLAETSTRARVLRVAGAMLVSNGLTVALQIAMVPALIWAWGATLYGEWLVLYTIPGYLALSDFGIITTANNRIDAQCARGHFGAANRTYFNSVLLLSGLIGAMLAIAVLVWVILGDSFSSLFETLSPSEVTRAGAVLFADAMILLVFNHHAALYRTLGHFNWTVNWQAAGRVAPIVALCGVALTGAGLMVAALIMLALRLMFLIVLALDLRRRIGWLQRGWLRASRVETVLLLRGAVGFMTLPLSNILYLHITTLIVATVSSPVGVADFATLRTFTRMIPQVVSIAGRSLWSEIAQAEARGAHDAVHAMRARVLRQTLVMSALAALCYLALGHPFYMFWTRGALPFDSLLFWAFLANAVAIALYSSLEVFVLSVNRVGGYATFFLMVTVAQILVAWAIVRTTGLAIFPALGFLAGVATCSYLLISERRKVRASGSRRQA